MITSPYLTEFHGGRFDGLRQPSDFVLPSTRLELPTRDVSHVDGAFRRYAVYHHRRTMVTLVDDSPVITFHMYYIGTKVASERPTWTPRWISSLLSLFQVFRQRPYLDRRPSDDGILAPSGLKNVVRHG
jgi:hypothetical protein